METFKIQFSSNWYNREDIIFGGGSIKLQILKNEYLAFMSKSKIWRKCLKKFGVSKPSKYSYSVKVVK